MTRADEQVAAARANLLEAETSVLHAFASMRASLNRLEEENRQLRQESLKQQNKVYTEQEFAAELKVSPEHLARLRKRGEIEPLNVGGLIRYSSATHLARLEEIFAEKPVRTKLRRIS